ncbi:MAG: sulfurtransferase [Granulosicoccus sp.]
MNKNSALISAADLKSALDNPDTKLFDMRGTWSSPARSLPEDYAAGHIPSAVLIDWTTEFLEPDVEVGLASVADFAQATASFKNLGINRNDLVVLYDDYHHMLAGRIWWAMRFWGFENVKVLNGGWKHWKAQGYETSTTESKPDIGSFVPVEHEQLRVSMEEFLQIKNASCVIDARGKNGYAGNEDDERSGHIPGAINIPFSLTLDDKSGLFHDNETLISLFDRQIPNWRTARLVSSCGAGYSGTVLMLALLELGVESTLFDDSFSVWKRDLSRPVERGDGSASKSNL